MAWPAIFSKFSKAIITAVILSKVRLKADKCSILSIECPHFSCMVLVSVTVDGDRDDCHTALTTS